MVKEQYRLALQGDVQNLLFSYMRQNQISAADMEDAINSVLVKIKDQVLQEFIQAVSQPPKEEENSQEEEKENGEQQESN